MVAVLFCAALGFNGVKAYTDDAPSSWANDKIRELEDSGVLGEFKVLRYHSNMTRLEFVELMVRLYEELNGPIVNYKGSYFDDTESDWALKARKVGITKGIGDNKFGPEQSLTREQLAVFLVKTLELSGSQLDDSPVDFVDKESFSSWAVASINKAYNGKLVSGVSSRELRFDVKGSAATEIGMILVHNALEANEPTWRNRDLHERPTIARIVSDGDLRSAVDSKGNKLIEDSYKYIYKKTDMYYFALDDNGGFGIFNKYGDVVFPYKEDLGQVNYFYEDDIVVFKSKDTSNKNIDKYSTYDFVGKSLDIDGYQSTKGNGKGVFHAFDNTYSNGYINWLVITSEGARVELTGLGKVTTVARSSDTHITVTHYPENALDNKPRLAIIANGGNVYSGYTDITGIDDTRSEASYLRCRYKIEEHSETIGPNYLEDYAVHIYRNDGKLYKFSRHYSSVELVDGGLRGTAYEKNPNGGANKFISEYMAFESDQMVADKFVGKTLVSRIDPSLFYTKDVYPFNQELWYYREDDWQRNVGIITADGRIVLDGSQRDYYETFAYDMIVFAQIGKDRNGDTKYVQGVYDIAKDEIVVKPDDYLSIVIKEDHIELNYNGDLTTLAIHGSNYVPEDPTKDVWVHQDYYYPTMKASDINFENDPLLKYAIEGYKDYNNGLPFGRVQDNKVWMGSFDNYYQAENIIFFNGNNEVLIHLEYYNQSTLMWLKKVLNHTFSYEVAYPLIRQIDEDMHRTLSRIAGEKYYHTVDLDNQSVSPGQFQVLYDDQGSAFEILVTYEDDVYAKGVKAYNDMLLLNKYENVKVADNELRGEGSVINYAYPSREALDQIIEDASNYYGHKYSVTLDYAADDQIYIHHLASKITFKTEKLGIWKVEAQSVNDYDSLSLKWLLITPESHEFIKYTIDGKYGAYGQSIYNQILEDMDYSLEKAEVDNLSDGEIFRALQGRKSYTGPFAIVYGANAIDIYPTYFIHEELFDTVSGQYYQSIFDIGLTEVQSPEYYFNYFEKYGEVSTYSGNGYSNVVLTPDHLFFSYVPGGRNFEIDYYSYDNHIGIKMEDIGKEGYYTVDFLEDFFKLVIGEDDTALVMKEMEEVFYHETKNVANIDFETYEVIIERFGHETIVIRLK